MSGLSGAMLLLLLASTLLLIPFCGSQKMYGKKYGKYFTFKNEGKSLQGIRVYKTVAGLKGIQLMYGGTWSKVQGQEDSEMDEFLLEEDEEVTEVGGKTGTLCIHSLIVSTNTGRKVTLGKKGDTDFHISVPPDKKLQGIFGTRVYSCIWGIGFIWG